MWSREVQGSPMKPTPNPRRSMFFSRIHVFRDSGSAVLCCSALLQCVCVCVLYCSVCVYPPLNHSTAVPCSALVLKEFVKSRGIQGNPPPAPPGLCFFKSIGFTWMQGSQPGRSRGIQGSQPPTIDPNIPAREVRGSPPPQGSLGGPGEPFPQGWICISVARGFGASRDFGSSSQPLCLRRWLGLAMLATTDWRSRTSGISVLLFCLLVGLKSRTTFELVEANLCRSFRRDWRVWKRST